MAVPGASRLTQAEKTELDVWSFLQSYKKYRTELLDIAKPLYTITRQVLSVNQAQSPDKDQFYEFYRVSLMSTDLYVKKIAGKKYNLPPSLYEHFADLLAKYVIDQDWGV